MWGEKWSMVLSMLLFGIFSFLFAALIPIGHGYGWDGLNYGTWAQDFYNRIIVEGVHSYHAQRILPSAIIHYTMRLFEVSMDPQHEIEIFKISQNIITGFKIYNLILLVFGTYVWTLILEELKLGKKGKWLGFIGLFINFAILKDHWFEPVKLDPTALFLGVLLLYFYLKNKSTAVLIVSIIGAFCWPTALALGGLLYIFPKKQLNDHPISANASAAVGVIVVSIMLTAVLSVLYVYYVVTLPNYFGFEPIDSSLLALSVIALLIYMYLVTKPILTNKFLYNFKNIIESLKLKNLMILIVIVVIIKIAHYYLSNKTTEVDHVGSFVYYIIRLSIQRPLVFFVGHVVYFGPLVILMMLLWKSICKIIFQYGIGLTLFFLINIIISINSESRQLIFALPFFVAFTVKTLEPIQIKPYYYWIFGVIALLYSKVWYSLEGINTFDWHITDDFFSFPFQRYLMNIGSYMNAQMFFLQGTVILVTAILFYYSFVKKIPLIKKN